MAMVGRKSHDPETYVILSLKKHQDFDDWVWDLSLALEAFKECVFY